MPNIICFGEMLIDFICSDTGVPLKNGTTFIKKAGGAPANVAVGISKLGGSSGFLGKVGSDPFGVFLKETLDTYGVDTSQLLLDNKHKTSLAFVSLKEDGERDFTFYREPGADTLLSENEIDMNYIGKADIFHYGSISLIEGPTRKTSFSLLKHAQDKNVLLSYDPNLRLNLWPSKEKARKGILEGMKYADIVKVSEEELEFITEMPDTERALNALHSLGPHVVLVTYGKEGALVSNKDNYRMVRGKAVKAVDATGAGDAFTAGFLYQLQKQSYDKRHTGVFKPDVDILERITRFANGVGAIVTTKYGAMSSLPSIGEVPVF